MNRIIRIFLAFILSFSMITPITGVSAKEEVQESVMPRRQYESMDDVNFQTSTSSKSRARVAMPSSYSSVEQGYVTSVKNQNPNGNCWAFAACSVAETYLIKNNLATKDIDLSEAHLNYFTYNNKGDNYSNIDNDHTYAIADTYYNIGIAPTMVQLALNNFGLADEKDYPLANVRTMTGNKSDQYNTKYRLTNSNLICDRVHKTTVDYGDKVKQAILKNGSVFATYDHFDNYYNYQNGSYYNPNYDTYLNHAITIVGWDDNYSASNFSYKPSRNGAWLIKNSWGSGFGNDGYFWMSYDESSLGYVYSFEFAPINNTNLYQYDGTENSSSYLTSEFTETYANVFQGKKEVESLEAVTLGIRSLTPYTLKIYTGLTNPQNPDTGTEVLSQSGVTENIGINYINLNNKIYIHKGEYYAIVFTLEGASKNEAQIMCDESLSASDIQFVCDYSNEYCLKQYYNNSWYKFKDLTTRIKGVVKDASSVSISSVSLNKTKLDLNIGTTETLQATIHPDNATDNRKLTWKSTNPSIATVDQNGKVTPIKEGSCEIMVTTSNGKTATCQVNVTLHINSVTLNINKKELDVKDTVQLQATIDPSNTTDSKQLTWETSNPTIAKVDNTGKVTAVSEGDATITVTTSNGKQATCQITVIKHIKTITLNKSELQLNKSETETIVATANPDDTIYDSWTWSSENTNVATVNQKGEVTAVGGGTTNIVVTTTNGKVAKCKVTVVSPITSVTLNKTNLLLVQGKTETLQATINPNDTTDDKTIKWKSSNTNVATVDVNGKVTGVNPGTATITATTSNNKQATCKVTVIKQVPNVTYRTHVQSDGWQTWKSNGEMSGTSGRSLRLEGIEIKLTNNSSYKGSVQYQTHVQDIGWQEWKSDGKMSGTSGQSKRLEAIRIRLTDELKENYDIYYRVHAQDYGWLDWAKNGEESGTSGLSKRLEGIEIKIVEKGGQAPGGTGEAYVQQNIGYQTHVQDIGWQEKKYNGEMSGTSGKSKRLEGIKISLSNQKKTGSIEYQTHVQNIGWQEWKSNGEMSGTSGKSLRLEAIRIKLTGEMENSYDVYYRVHAQGFGWLDWAKNGEMSGTSGYSYRLEGIEIKLVKKGKGAPGSTSHPFYKK